MESFRECPICFYEYDYNSHKPIVLPWCGHSLCKECTEHTLLNSSLKCAVCNQEGELDLSRLIINFSLLSMLEIKIPEKPKAAVALTKRAKLTELCMHKVAFIRSRKDRLVQALMEAEAEVDRSEAAVTDFITRARCRLSDLEDYTLAKLGKVRAINKEKTEQELYQVEEDMDHFMTIVQSLEATEADTADIVEQLKKPMNYNYEVNLCSLQLGGEETLAELLEQLEDVRIVSKQLPVTFETFDGYLLSDIAQFVEPEEQEGESSGKRQEEEWKVRADEQRGRANAELASQPVAESKPKKKRKKKKPKQAWPGAPDCFQQ
jgi:glycerophosphoryl diester phosphodiesterase